MCRIRQREVCSTLKPTLHSEVPRGIASRCKTALHCTSGHEWSSKKYMSHVVTKTRSHVAARLSAAFKRTGVRDVSSCRCSRCSGAETCCLRRHGLRHFVFLFLVEVVFVSCVSFRPKKKRWCVSVLNGSSVFSIVFEVALRFQFFTRNSLDAFRVGLNRDRGLSPYSNLTYQNAHKCWRHLLEKRKNEA